LIPRLDSSARQRIVFSKALVISRVVSCVRAYRLYPQRPPGRSS